MQRSRAISTGLGIETLTAKKPVPRILDTVFTHCAVSYVAQWAIAKFTLIQQVEIVGNCNRDFCSVLNVVLQKINFSRFDRF